MAEQTRHDFENGLISDAELTATAEFCGIEDIAGWVDLTSASYRILFPEWCCDWATSVLKTRLGFGEVIQGGYFDCKYPGSHTFLGVGRTALGPDTIVDITADQFECGTPPVYLGQLALPWTRTPKFMSRKV